MAHDMNERNRLAYDIDHETGLWLWGGYNSDIGYRCLFLQLNRSRR